MFLEPFKWDLDVLKKKALGAKGAENLTQWFSDESFWAQVKEGHTQLAEKYAPQPEPEGPKVAQNMEGPDLNAEAEDAAGDKELTQAQIIQSYVTTNYANFILEKG